MWVRRGIAFVLFLMVAFGVLAGALRASLPQLEGDVEIADLTSDVVITRDSSGVPTIRATKRGEAAYGMGFVHAQDRLFQMDLFRRLAAGELAEIFGSFALALDIRNRNHRFRARARAALEVLPPEERELLTLYAAGVNRGIENYLVYPPEYLFLFFSPKKWLPEDSLLVGMMMFQTLENPTVDDDLTREVLKSNLPADAYKFFTSYPSVWESPVDGVKREVPAFPSPESLALLRERVLAASSAPGSIQSLSSLWESMHLRQPAFGSNSFAVSSARSVNGRALLANDMHLNLGVPNTWYRLRLEYLAGNETVQVVGPSLPGLPLLVTGSNGHVAWSFTNSYLDMTDSVVLDGYDGSNRLYLTPKGREHVKVHRELISVRGQSPYQLDVDESIFGPIVVRSQNQVVAMKWTGYDPQAINLKLIEMEQAKSVQQALEIGPRLGIPSQNLLAVDSQGNIGLTFTGRFPNRVGCTGEFPRGSSAPECWQGVLAESAYPRLVNPPNGLIWTANNRVMSTPEYRRLGDYNTKSDGRAGVIEEQLKRDEFHSVESLLAIQLSLKASKLLRWYELAQKVVAGQTLKPEVGARVREILRDWDEMASSKSSSYFFVTRFKEVLERKFLPLIESLGVSSDGKRNAIYRPETLSWDEPIWAIVEQAPDSLLPAHVQSWDALFNQAIEEALAASFSQGAVHRWDDEPGASLLHPLTRVFSPFRLLFGFPQPARDGDYCTPRQNSVRVGVSVRTVVSPGYEGDGIFQMPTGQSGHPLSRFYETGFENWNTGQPAPLLPDETKFTLRLYSVQQ